MKRIIFLLFFIALLSGSSEAQLNVWRWQSPLPEGNFLYSVQMISLKTIYACGDNGTFIRTSDGGANWDLQNNILKLKETWNCLSFYNEKYGMCCGDTGKVIKTTDGGNTWTLLDLGVKIKLNSIVVVDTNIALVVLLNGGILKTTNGGATWYAIPSEGNQALYSIRKLRPDFLYVTGYAGTLMTSSDTGASWNSIRTPNGNTYYCGNFTDINNVSLIGENGIILNTPDLGFNWTHGTVDSFVITANLNYVDGKDPNHITIVGDYGTFLNTSNGGKDWSFYYTGTNEHIKCVNYFDTMHAAAVGRDGVILLTSDGGRSWYFVPNQPDLTSLYSIAYPKGDTSLGVTVGYGGIIRRTTNGGQLWTMIPSGTNNTLRGVAFADENTVVAVGEFGTIRKSVDGGVTWDSIPSLTKANLYSVSFATPNDGIIVGDSNKILKTTTAGQFWTHQYLGVQYHQTFFQHSSYPDKMHVFITGYGESNNPSCMGCGETFLFKSIDGGITWADMKTEGYCASFADSLNGIDIYTDPNGEFWWVEFTSDGGVTWKNVHRIRTNPVICSFADCIDPMHSRVIGSGGYIGLTTDGGVTWNVEQSNTLHDLYACGFGSLKAGNAVGNRGNIMRITTDETLNAVTRQSDGESGIMIEGNYPNPFSGITTITYSLQSDGFTQMKIFTVEGKELSSTNSEFQTGGEHRITFDGSGLAAGTYILRITSGAMSAEGKMVLKK
jgi:photosystem II stability/assembly factor-like uncharacterized protein